MSSGSKYLLASDGFPARISGRWAMQKLQTVSLYMSVVNRAMKEKWPHRCFIDLMAGCGRCILMDGRTEFDGSPLVSLKCSPGFTSLVFVESDSALFSALKHRIGTDPRAHLLQEDCNQSTTIARIHALVPRASLSVAFLDNLGMDVTMATIAALTANRRMDLLVTFQVGDVRRNVARAFNDPKESARWDAFFGGPGWRIAVEQFESRERRAHDIAAALMEHYGHQLARLGYEYSSKLPRAMKNNRNAELYRVMHYSKHRLGQHLFEEVSKDRREQRLF